MPGDERAERTMVERYVVARLLPYMRDGGPLSAGQMAAVESVLQRELGVRTPPYSIRLAQTAGALQVHLQPAATPVRVEMDVYGPVVKRTRLGVIRCRRPGGADAGKEED